MTPIVGIDLGTTNSVVAYMRNGRPEIVPNAEGDALTPSVVAFTADKRTWIGQIAKAQAAANAERTVFSIKRHMGVSDLSGGSRAAAEVVSSIKRRMGSDYVVEVDDRVYTPQQISSMILAKLKTDAELFLGEPVEKAVITVPAYFNDTQRRATKDAGTIAGLDVVRLVNEPTAAALAYGLDLENAHTILVWDLGGGTFDVSILELSEGMFQVKAVCGDTWLGGDDYDERLASLLAERFRREGGVRLGDDSGARRVLRELAEDAKIKLSTSPSATVTLPLPSAAAPGRRPRVTISREEFERLTDDLTRRMVGPTRQALSDAGVDPIEIDRVLLVGGVTRMPAIRRLAQEVTGLRPYCHVDPDKVVALGAAIQAGVLAGQVRKVTLLDVNPLSLGIETQGGVFARIIGRNTPIPASKGQLFTNARDGQTSVDIHMLQGEREMAAHNISLGCFDLTDVEPQPRGEARIEVTFHIDANGMVQVSALDLHTNNEKRIRVDSPSRLSTDEIQCMVSDARAHAESDQREKEEVLAAIRAQNLIAAASVLAAQAREVLDPVGPQEALDVLERATHEAKCALADGRPDGVRAASKLLEEALKVLDRAVKAQENTGGGTAATAGRPDTKKLEGD